MALGPKEMQASIIRNLKSKTGKSLEKWETILSDSGLTEKKESIQWLKSEYGLGHFQAQIVFQKMKGLLPYENVENFEKDLFKDASDKKIYDLLDAIIFENGKEVKKQPCKTYIPYYRKNQFALLTKVKEGVLLGLHLPSDHNFETFANSCSVGSDRINSSYILKSDKDMSPEIMEAINVAYTIN